MTLHLNLKKQWYDMILSGEKEEEYREIKKHWVQRICEDHPGMIGGNLMDAHEVISYTFKKFDFVQFRNGYSKDARYMLRKCLGIEITTGKTEWGADPGKLYFVIKLG